MRPSERYAAAVKSGYLSRPDRRERDLEWLACCRAEQRPYIVLTRTPDYAYLLIDCSPLAAPPAPAVWERLTRLGAAAVRESPSTQAKVRITGNCFRIQSVAPADAQAIAERVPALFPLPASPQTNVIDLARRLSLRERARAGHTPGGDAA